MKNALELCSLACNPQAPSPTASLVKVEDGFMVAYGGLMCIRVPVKFAFGCAFNPAALKVFYRKARNQISYSVKKNKLILQEGNERVTVPCLPPSEMVTLDAIAPVQAVDFDVKLLKYVSGAADPTHHNVGIQGVVLHDGNIRATNARVFMIAAVDAPEGLTFNIHKDACAALAKFKAKCVAMATDGRVIKFIFADDSSLTTHMIADTGPDYKELLLNKTYKKMKIPEDVIEDLLKIECFHFILDDGIIAYQSEDKSITGRLEVPGVTGPAIAIRKENFGFILRNGGTISRETERGFLRSVNGDVCVIAVTMPI